MTAIALLSVERIKLFTTRSPYWCLLGALAAGLLVSLLISTVDSGNQASTYLSQRGMSLGMMIIMVLAALAVTTEYRFGTIRTSFLAVPRRIQVLGAKTVVVAALAAGMGLITSLASFGLMKLIAGGNTQRQIELSTGADWRMVVGWAALFATAAVIAVSIGTLLRHSAGAISIVLLWPLMIENLVLLIPNVGAKVHPWLPFTAGDSFVSPPPGTQVFDQTIASGGPTPIEGLLVFIGTAVVLWVFAAVVLRRRDA